MAIIIASLYDDIDGRTGQPSRTFPDYCILKEQFCFDGDDDTFVTIGLGGGTEITKAQLHTRALSIHGKIPFQNITGDENPFTFTDKTDAEVETMIDDWCTEKNVA